MITKELIEQINYFARKARTIGLTPEEKAEQALLRRRYLDGIRQQVIATLEQVQQPQGHSHDCSCGCQTPKTH